MLYEFPVEPSADYLEFNFRTVTIDNDKYYSYMGYTILIGHDIMHKYVRLYDKLGCKAKEYLLNNNVKFIEIKSDNYCISIVSVK